MNISESLTLTASLARLTEHPSLVLLPPLPQTYLPETAPETSTDVPTVNEFVSMEDTTFAFPTATQTDTTHIENPQKTFDLLNEYTTTTHDPLQPTPTEPAPASFAETMPIPAITPALQQPETLENTTELTGFDPSKYLSGGGNSSPRNPSENPEPYVQGTEVEADTSANEYDNDEYDEEQRSGDNLDSRDVMQMLRELSALKDM